MNNSIKWPQNRVCSLFGIENPIVQAGMVWVSGGKLAAAASNSGCLGLIGAGSMKPDVLRLHIKKAKQLTSRPVGVNIPLLYREAEEQVNTALEEGIRIFFTSAGSPKRFTPSLKKEGCIVVHVTSSVELAQKCQDHGVDAVVLEGFEAGGHNGRDELTTLVLLQQAMGRLSVPVIAAGGIGTGAAIASALALGADGVQMGTVFAATTESSAHENFRQAMIEAKHNATMLCMKELVPVRLLDNPFARRVLDAEINGANREKLADILGKGRAKLGMLDGDLSEGELEVGQIVSEITELIPCATLVERLKADYLRAVQRLCS